MTLYKRLMLVAGLVVLLGACSTVTIHPKSSAKLIAQPTLQESKPFFLWGLVGEQRVNVAQVCGDSSVKQMQSQQTFADGLLAVLTFGIYSPHTVKVWC